MSGKNSAHFARRTDFTKGLVEDGIFEPAHVTSKNNPTDFMGKLVTADKYRMSMEYLSNWSAEVPPTEDDIKRAKAAFDAQMQEGGITA